ncbi:hypothetical protein CTB96_14465 [Cryobacterium arcticum]|uniref:Uncharacterized protein n=2 Tax=Cryobacterium arcticum TaxID=670052 RepID=A0A317ZT32_9MICO|nr:hypothetical protein CTB96_14465 [Cryobacterium arcticum]
MPVNLAEFVPDDGSRRVQRTIGTLKVMSVIALVGGAVGMLGAVLRRDLGDIELAAFVSISIVLLIVACAFPVALLVLGRRHRHREATRSVAGSATVWGVICVSLGVLAVGPALGNSVVGAIEDAAVRSSSPTPAETEFTPDEVRAQAESLLTDLAAVAGGAVPDTLLPGEDAPGLRSEPCQLSNLGPGVIISSSGDRYDTPGDPLAALDAVEAYWRDAGYEPRRSGGDTTVDRIHPQVRVSGGAIERVGVYATDDIGYNLIIEYESICVAE